MTEESQPEIYPETYVAFVVGTNLAFVDGTAAEAFVKKNLWRYDQAPADTWRDIAPAIMSIPAGYLSPQTKIVYGAPPDHKPAGVRQNDEQKPQKPSKKKAAKA